MVYYKTHDSGLSVGQKQVTRQGRNRVEGAGLAMKGDPTQAVLERALARRGEAFSPKVSCRLFERPLQELPQRARRGEVVAAHAASVEWANVALGHSDLVFEEGSEQVGRLGVGIAGLDARSRGHEEQVLGEGIVARDQAIAEDR